MTFTADNYIDEICFNCNDM